MAFTNFTFNGFHFQLRYSGCLLELHRTWHPESDKFLLCRNIPGNTKLFAEKLLHYLGYAHPENEVFSEAKESIYTNTPTRYI